MYVIWGSMLRRCNNPKDKSYKNFGGKGIRVCDRWKNDFLAFLSDMGEKPGPGYTVDRIDKDGDYEPENCRWATYAQQANSRRSNVVVEAFGKKMTMAEWSREIKIPKSTIRMRLVKLGQAPELALTKRVLKKTLSGSNSVAG
jgi:hypothetical protein